MKYRTLTGTGISVSNLALGTMGFGTETDEAEAFEILDKFMAAVGNLIDTANVYGAGGNAERLVDSVPYAASVAVWFMMASYSIGVNFPSRR